VGPKKTLKQKKEGRKKRESPWGEGKTVFRKRFGRGPERKKVPTEN